MSNEVPAEPFEEQTVFTMRPIGVVRTSAQKPYNAARQTGWDESHQVATVELHAGLNFEQALRDLDGCDRIWLVTVFDRVNHWKPLVQPPRGRTKRGVFATRSPHRPNPIGLSCVRLLGISGRILHVEDTDLLDGTPVLDIKPYVAYADAFPESALPWMDEIDAKPFEVIWEFDASAVQADHRTYVERVLSADPLPHPYRRIRADEDGTYVLSVERSRIRYSITESTVRIIGYTVDLR
jgi:tRNA-Thr(GGU) m(6)t(6)A37 methyltransferase TsaA